MNAAAALARESTALAASSAVEKRPSGMVARNLARRVSSTGPPAKSADRPGSGLNTGVMQFTRVLSGPRSAAIHLLVGVDAGAGGAVVPGQSGAGAQAGGGGDVDETAAAGFAHRRHGVDGAQV